MVWRVLTELFPVPKWHRKGSQKQFRTSAVFRPPQEAPSTSASALVSGPKNRAVFGRLQAPVPALDSPRPAARPRPNPFFAGSKIKSKP